MREVFAMRPVVDGPGGDRPRAELPDEPKAFVSSSPASWGSVTFPLVTRARREMSITLSVQPVFGLKNGKIVSRRIRRLVRHKGGEPALRGLGRPMLESADLRRIDLLTLNHGSVLFRPGNVEGGVLPAFWRTVATGHGRFAMIYAGDQAEAPPGRVWVEVVGMPDRPDVQAVAEAIENFENDQRGIILHIPPDPGLAERLVGAGCDCLSVDFAAVDYDNPRGWHEAERLIRAARKAASRVLILNIAPHWGAAAAEAGATHAVFCSMETLRA
ncbi:hypothetical protein [Brevundimonas kwangchunensis]